MTRGSWGRPVRPFVGDERQWRRFRNEVSWRIKALRQAEGINSLEQPWQTFDVALPARLPAPVRPVRLRLAPASENARDARGRFLPTQERAS